MFEGSNNNLIQGGQFTAVRNTVRVDGYGKKAFDILLQHVAVTAVHNSGERYDPPRCHPNTRIAITSNIKKWLTTYPESKVFWLYGAAGAGKSALAQALAEICYEHAGVVLIGTFFFSRTRPREGRNDEKRVVATLVYQLVQTIPEVKSYVETALNRDPLIFDRSIEVQFKELLFDPLMSAIMGLDAEEIIDEETTLGDVRNPVVITDKKFLAEMREELNLGSTPKGRRPLPAIPLQNQQLKSRSRQHKATLSGSPLPLFIIFDGLDECHSHEAQCYLLETLDKMIQLNKKLPLKVLVASRPEVHIRSSFDAIKHHTILHGFDLSKDLDASGDIQRFLVEKCQELKETHPMRRHIPPSWPNDEKVAEIVLKSSNHFIYASIVMKYIQSVRHLPHERMEVILGIYPTPFNQSPFAELDALYALILSQVEDTESVLRILAILLLPTPSTFYGLDEVIIDDTQLLTPAFLGKLLSYSPGGLEVVLSDLVSIVDMEIPSQEMRFFHASFRDYLCDPSRSGKFYVGDRIPIAHADLARGLLQYTSQQWHRPVLQISSPSYAFTNLMTYRSKVLAFYTPFNFHYSRALPGQEFAPDLLKFSFVAHFQQGYRSQQNDKELSLLLMFYSEFLGFLEEANAYEAVAKNLPIFHARICEFLSHYESTNYALADALALAHYDILFVLPYTMPRIVKPSSNAIGMVDDDNRMHLGQWAQLWPDRASEIFQKGLLEVLQDPQKAGHHFLDSDKRLSALIRCIDYLITNHGGKLLGVEQFNLTAMGVFSTRIMTNSSKLDYDAGTDMTLMTRAVILLSEISSPTPTSQKLCSILRANEPVIQNVLNSPVIQKSPGARAAATDLSKIILDFVAMNKEPFRFEGALTPVRGFNAPEKHSPTVKSPIKNVASPSVTPSSNRPRRRKTIWKRIVKLVC